MDPCKLTGECVLEGTIYDCHFDFPCPRIAAYADGAIEAGGNGGSWCENAWQREGVSPKFSGIAGIVYSSIHHDSEAHMVFGRNTESRPMRRRPGQKQRLPDEMFISDPGQVQKSPHPPRLLPSPPQTFVRRIHHATSSGSYWWPTRSYGSSVTKKRGRRETERTLNPHVSPSLSPAIPTLRSI